MKSAFMALSRRRFSLLLCTAPVLISSRAAASGAETDLAGIEAKTGGRIGVAALDLASGRIMEHRGGERFAMCSTFKWLLAAFVLERCDAGEESLSRKVAFKKEDLVFYSPVTEKQADRGGMSVGAMCEAAIQTSDNTAANLLLATLGGPEGFTAAARRHGDMVTRLDRLEPMLNENRPGDPRDTTSPLAMAETMKTFLFGNALSDEGRERLKEWMIGATTGLDRLRAGLPQGWTAGDKTGTSERDANNDLAFAIPSGPGAAGPFIIVSFINAPDPVGPSANAVHANIARAVIAAFCA